jgi:hypothetical protein
MLAKINLFVAWFLIVQIFFRNMLTIVGTWLLYTLGMPVPLHEQFGWLAGALMLVSVLLIIRNTMGELPPGVGKREGKGYQLGHRVLFASSLLAFGVYILPMLVKSIHSEDMQEMVSMFVIDFMYMSLAVFGVGVSLIYQSAQSAVTNLNL